MMFLATKVSLAVEVDGGDRLDVVDKEANRLVGERKAGDKQDKGGDNREAEDKQYKEGDNREAEDKIKAVMNKEQQYREVE